MFGVTMHVFRLFTSIAMLAACYGCIPSTSISPPPGWRQVENRRFDLWVPPDVKAWAPLDTNALSDHFTGDTIELTFQYGTILGDLSGFTNAPHYACSVERIDGKKAKITSFYYWGSRPYHELISAHFPEVDGKELSLTATCRTTNDYDTASKILRTLRFK